MAPTDVRNRLGPEGAIVRRRPVGGQGAVAPFFFSSRRRHTRLVSDWSSDVCSSDLELGQLPPVESFANRPGSGVVGRVEGHEVEVGRSDGAITVSWDGEPRATLVVRD